MPIKVINKISATGRIKTKETTWNIGPRKTVILNFLSERDVIDKSNFLYVEDLNPQKKGKKRSTKGERKDNVKSKVDFEDSNVRDQKED